MNTNITLFDYQNQSLRTLTNEQGTWFCLTDLLNLLETKSHPNDQKKLLLEYFGDEDVISVPISDNLGREQLTTFISEPAATFIISRSRTEVGKQLNRWIHVEVLPSIRKTGSYSINNLKDEKKDLLDYCLHALNETFKDLPINPNILAQQKINAAIKINPSSEIILQDSLKLLVDSTANQKQLLNPTQIGKLLNPPKSAKSVNLLLLDKGLQYRNTNKSSSKESDYLPTELAKGYYELTLDGSNGTTYQQLRWYESIVELLS